MQFLAVNHIPNVTYRQGALYDEILTGMGFPPLPRPLEQMLLSLKIQLGASVWVSSIILGSVF